MDGSRTSQAPGAPSSPCLGAFAGSVRGDSTVPMGRSSRSIRTMVTYVNRIVVSIAAALSAVLVIFAGGYGYHRDELYFVAAGHHLDWAYADQGPFTPLVARAMSEIAPHSLTVLRIPSALAAGATVLLTGLLARELGGGRRAQVIAAACTAVGGLVLFTGHILSTSTFDLLAWTAVSWLAVRAVRRGDDRLWLVAGVVLGVALLNKPLPAFLALGLLAGVVIAGPRRLLRNPYVLGGSAIALVLFAPWIVWQARHGWPQVDVSRSIASGGSASSQPWWTIVPFQALLVGPLLAPVWIAGLVRLFRDPAVRDCRFLAWAWLVLAVVFMASGGKPYYLAGPLAAHRRARRRRRGQRRDRGGRRPAAASRARHRAGNRRQSGSGGDDWLARVRAHGRAGLSAGEPGGDRDPQLRRGGRHRPVRPRPGAAPCAQRPQRVRRLGPAAGWQRARRRDRPSAARPGAPARLPRRGPHRQRGRRRQRRAGCEGAGVPRAGPLLAPGVARAAALGVSGQAASAAGQPSAAAALDDKAA